MRGHNLPTVPKPAQINDLLRDEHSDLIARRDELQNGEKKLPASVETEEQASRVSDYVRQINGAIKSAEDQRKGAKDPYLVGGQAVDGFFNKIKHPLQDLKAKAQALLKPYQERKAEAERRRREEEQRQKEEEARKERERLKKEREENDRRIREAEEEAERARQEKEEAERVAAEAEERAAKAEQERDDQAKAHAEELAQANRAKAAAAGESERAAEAEKTDAKVDNFVARRAYNKADAERAAAAKHAAEPTSKLSTVHGEYGSQSQLREQLDIETFDRDRLDLETLRPHFKDEHLEAAIRQFLKMGGKKLRGAKFFVDSKVATR